MLYSLPRPRVVELLTPIVALPGLKLPHKRTVLRALTLWASSGVDFVDALSVAQMERQKIEVIASYDRDFRRFTQVKLREP